VDPGDIPDGAFERLSLLLRRQLAAHRHRMGVHVKAEMALGRADRVPGGDLHRLSQVVVDARIADERPAPMHGERRRVARAGRLPGVLFGHRRLPCPPKR
jgi:hypothetical protein